MLTDQPAAMLIFLLGPWDSRASCNWWKVQHNSSWIMLNMFHGLTCTHFLARNAGKLHSIYCLWSCLVVNHSEQVWKQMDSYSSGKMPPDARAEVLQMQGKTNRKWRRGGLLGTETHFHSHKVDGASPMLLPQGAELRDWSRGVLSGRPLPPYIHGTVTSWIKDPPKWGAAGPGTGSSRQLCRWDAPVVTVIKQGGRVSRWGTGMANGSHTEAATCDHTTMICRYVHINAIARLKACR